MWPDPTEAVFARGGERPLLRNLLCALLVSGGLFGWGVMLSQGSGHPVSEALKISKLESAANENLVEILKARGPNATEEERVGFARRLDADVLAPWREARTRLNSLTTWPGSTPLKTLKEYFRVREEGLELLIRSLRENDNALEQRAWAKLIESKEMLESLEKD